IVSNRNLPRFKGKTNTFVEALVSPAQEKQAAVACQFSYQRLIKPFASRCQKDQEPRLGGLLLDRLDGVEDRLRPDHHSRPAAKGAVVDTLVLSLGPVPNIPKVNLHQTGVEGQFEDALAEIPLKDFGKQRQHVE